MSLETLPPDAERVSDGAFGVDAGEHVPVGGGSFGYIPAIDGLRALAVVAVMVFHGGELAGGYLGVDAFFVLSGYLITSLILHEVRDRGRLDGRRFWSRRARRLLPALYLMLFAVCGYAAFFAADSDLARIRGDALSTVFYVANWRAVLAGHGYWDLFAAPSPLEHMWSLAIEEQFYIVWPLVILVTVAVVRRAARRSSRPRAVAPVVFVVALTGAVASALWCAVVYSADDSSRAYLGTDTRAAAILFGSALAAWTVWRGHVRGRAARIVLETVGIVSAVGVGAAWFVLDGQDPLLYRGGLVLCGVGVAAVIATVAHPVAGPLRALLGWRPLVVVGLISYGLYLWHWPLYVFLDRDRTGLDGPALLALRFAATFLVASLSYVLLEKPIRHGLWPARVNRVLLPLSVCALVGTIHLSTAGATAVSGPIPNGTDGVNLGDAGLGTSTSARRVLIVGDSIAGNLAFAAQKFQRTLDIAVASASSNGCVLPGVSSVRLTTGGVTRSIDPNPCGTTWLPGARRFAPDDLLVVYGTAAAFTDLEIGGSWVDVCDGEYGDWYRRQLTGLLSQMAPSATVHVALLPPPEGGWVPPYAEERIECINAIHRDLARTEDRYTTVDLASIVCPDGACREMMGTERFRPDGFHYSPSAAETVVRSLLAEMRAQS